jgi:uncharacterized protein (UPF0332 family)
LTYDLIETARRILNATWKNPRQNDLKRAVSTAYYAMFHSLAELNADLFIGTTKDRSDKAWRQAYRALEHGFAKNACQQARRLGFADDVVHFADTFVRMQEERHLADYDPYSKYDRVYTLYLIHLAENAIKGLLRAPRRDRRAFAVLVLLKQR